MLSGSRVSFLGHSTVLVEDSGVRLLTDPLLHDRVGHLRRHGAAINQGLWQGLDGLLISHLHHDHFDRRSLDLLDRGTRVVVPAGGGQLLRDLGFSLIDEVVAGDRIDFGDLSVLAVKLSLIHI